MGLRELIKYSKEHNPHTLHIDLKIPYVNDVINENIIKYNKKMEGHFQSDLGEHAQYTLITLEAHLSFVCH